MTARKKRAEDEYGLATERVKQSHTAWTVATRFQARLGADRGSAKPA